MGSEEYYELAVTPKKSTACLSCLSCVSVCWKKFRQHLEDFVDHNGFQRFILFCILINTFSMGIEYHNQVGGETWHEVCGDCRSKPYDITDLLFSNDGTACIAELLGVCSLFTEDALKREIPALLRLERDPSMFVHSFLITPSPPWEK